MSDSTKTKPGERPQDWPTEALNLEEAAAFIKKHNLQITGPGRLVPKKSAATETSPQPLPNLDLSTLENLDWNAPGTGFEVLKAIAALQEPQEASDVPSVPQ